MGTFNLFLSMVQVSKGVFARPSPGSQFALLFPLLIGLVIILSPQLALFLFVTFGSQR